MSGQPGQDPLGAVYLGLIIVGLSWWKLRRLREEARWERDDLPDLLSFHPGDPFRHSRITRQRLEMIKHTQTLWQMVLAVGIICIVMGLIGMTPLSNPRNAGTASGSPPSGSPPPSSSLAGAGGQGAPF